MEALLIILAAWWLLSRYSKVSSPFRILPRVIAHLMYHRQAQRRGHGFALIHAFAILAILYTLLMIHNGSLTAWFNVAICWVSFAFCWQVYRKHQQFRQRRNKRHALPRRHR
jgi:Ca2+/Na+ antiporter